jgi:hypothetical protein
MSGAARVEDVASAVHPTPLKALKSVQRLRQCLAAHFGVATDKSHAVARLCIQAVRMQPARAGTPSSPASPSLS